MTGPINTRPLIELEAVSKSFGPIRAVDGVSFGVRAGEVHGLCGHNGAGKSTVVKMLAGLLRPDQGGVWVDGELTEIGTPQKAQSLGVALVDQELSIVPILSVADNVLLGGLEEPFLNQPRAIRSRVRELLDLVNLTEVDPGDSSSDLSMGERQLVEIARVLGRNAKVLVLDEPTATLSRREIEHVFTAVRQVAAAGCGVLYVSHRLDEVLDLCDRVTVLRDGKLVETAQTEDISVDELISIMLGEIAPDPTPVVPPAGRTDEGAIEIDGLGVGRRIHDFNLHATPGRVYALAGQVGCGATQILRALAGLEPSAQGAVSIGGDPLALGSPRGAVTSGVAYLSNDRKGDGLFLGLSAGENLVSTRLEKVSTAGILNMSAFRRAAANLAHSIGLAPERLKEPVMNFSGGNQQKILLGRYLEAPETRLLLLDEPTRGVDVKGRKDIHAIVRATAREGTTVIFTSTEIDEILDLSDDIVTMRSGRVVGRHRRQDADTKMLLAEMTYGGAEAEAG